MCDTRQLIRTCAKKFSFIPQNITKTQHCKNVELKSAVSKTLVKITFYKRLLQKGKYFYALRKKDILKEPVCNMKPAISQKGHGFCWYFMER